MSLTWELITMLHSLTSLYLSNATAQLMVDHFATKQKATWKMRVTSMLSLLSMSRGEKNRVIDVFKAFAAAGLGTYSHHTGASANNSVFLWNSNSRETCMQIRRLAWQMRASRAQLINSSQTPSVLPTADTSEPAETFETDLFTQITFLPMFQLCEGFSEV